MSYKKIVMKEGKIKGFILVRTIEKAGLLFYLMKNSVNIDGLREKILCDDFGIISLPEQLRREMLKERLIC
jgi:NAD(P)H-nitrite reductase large subunit